MIFCFDGVPTWWFVKLGKAVGFSTEISTGWKCQYVFHSFCVYQCDMVDVGPYAIGLEISVS